VIILSSLLIAVVVGFVLNLTGAGGGIIAVPMIMELFDVPVKVATILSLLSVISSGLLGAYLKRKDCFWKISLTIWLGGMTGALMARPIKNLVSEKLIVIVFLMLSFWSIARTLLLKSQPTSLSQSVGHHQMKEVMSRVSIPTLIAFGVLLGSVSTFTGISGGILLVPFLMSVVRLGVPEATSTSLLTVGLTGCSSFLIQWKDLPSTVNSQILILLPLMVLIMTYVTLGLIHKIPSGLREKMRKIVFIAVVLIACVTLLARVF
jgi:uncharacterized membrane protein YfcA